MIRSSLLVAVLSVACPALAQLGPSPVPLPEGREAHTTNIVLDTAFDEGPAQVPPPSVFKIVKYPSPAGDLVAYLSPNPNLRRSVEAGGRPEDGKRYPALVWCHGGFGGIGDWLWELPQYTSSYRAREFVVMCPSWRGENDNPGSFEMFYGEVDDARAAIDYVAKLPYVDPKRIYIAGHSTGGTIALLTAMTQPKHLRAAFVFGAAPNLFNVLEGREDYAGVKPPFDRKNPVESYLRSPTFFVKHLHVPTWYFEGEDSFYPDDARLMARNAAAANAPFKVVIVKGGDHFNILEPVGELLAKQLAEHGDDLAFDLGQKAVQAAFEAHPNAAEHFANQGYDHIDSDPKRAKALFDRALSVNPEHLDALVNRGVVYERQGKLQLALADFNAALEIDPDDFYGLYNRGIVYHHLARYEDAMGDYNRAIVISPDDADAYTARAAVRADTNDPVGARQDYEKALALDPQNPEAREGLADIRQRQQIQSTTRTGVCVGLPVGVLGLGLFVFWLARSQRANPGDMGYRDGGRERRERRRDRLRRRREREPEHYDEFELVEDDVPDLEDSSEGEAPPSTG